jgi:hypothetical protein
MPLKTLTKLLIQLNGQILTSRTAIEPMIIRKIIVILRALGLCKKAPKQNKSRIKSSTKKPKIKVSVPKEQKNSSNMMINEKINPSIIDESILSQNLIVSSKNDRK